MKSSSWQKRILESLRENQEEMVSILRDLTNMDSPSTSKEHLDRFSTMLGQKWEKAGAKVAIIPQSKHGNHLRAEFGGGEEQILILCHMDTVWSAGESQRRPFKVENGKAYGPGVYDMKGGIVEAFFAVKTLKKMGLNPEKRVVILHNSDEEIGSPSSRQIIEEEARKSNLLEVNIEESLSPVKGS